MNIGSFKKNANGMLLGSVATAALDMPRLALKPVQSDNARAPAFEIMALNPGRRWVQVGAVWEATTREGETFYQGRIDDPSLPEPLPVALFRNSYEEAEAYSVAWSRPKPQQQRDGFGGDAGTGNGERRRPARDDGFGTGNATADGQLVPAGDVDDDIPF